MNLTREDYKAMIGLKKRAKSKRKRKSGVRMAGGYMPGGNVMANALFLARMLTKKNQNAKQRDAIVNTMDNKQMNQLSKVFKTFWKSNQQMPKKHLKRLQKDRRFVEAMMNPKIPLGIKKKILTQKGGILGALLPMVLKSVAAPILGGIAGKLF